ncbi:MAG: NrfD/PsrC family molybdoenzyme membrane anchor subunit [Chloroherpetonaceae bacterium]|nr:NrfD/PsrC family molybdoenzyme membrane anchor subunit [Chloroherpetonaceae bacterium]
MAVLSPDFIDETKSGIHKNPLVLGNPTFQSLTQDVCEVTEKRPPVAWYIAFFISASLAIMYFVVIGYLVTKGIGIWGNNTTVGWAWDITNFVWWVGIGHAGTLISAVLFLFRQKWRTSINRFSEAMTIFAVICAGMFPVIHMGRPWLIHWFLPLPNQMAMWPNFRSPLEWDVFAISTYLTVSILFWYVGLIPDLATMRDRAKAGIRKYLLGFFALGWRGGNRQWRHYERAYLILAALSTPLVLSVHTIVSFDFATSVIPGWHTTIFPPYFVAGAIFSGFAMVITLAVMAILVYPKIGNIITLRHFDYMNRVILVTGMMVGYAYGCEFFVAWYSGNGYESTTFILRATGPYAWAYWSMIFCNVVVPQIFWFEKMRTNVAVSFVASIFVNIGMWFERFVITVTSLSQDYLPSSWKYYTPTIFDIACYVGSIGLFMMLFLLFLRYMPMVAIAEIKGVLPEADPHAYPHNGHNGHAHHHEEKHEAPTPELVTKNGGH